MKKKETIEQVYVQNLEDSIENSKDLEIGSKEHFLAAKANSEQMKALAEYKKAVTDKKFEIVKVVGLLLAGIAALADAGSTWYDRRNKKIANNKILDKEINLMERYENQVYDKR